MIDFMIIGLPRSGTTWAANFFTTDRAICFHDPLYRTHYEDWDEQLPRRAHHRAEVGVSCTGIWRWADWLNDHPARKLILRRDFGDIQKSMAEIGLPALDSGAEAAIERVVGTHVHFSELFDPVSARAIWYHLTRNAGSFPMFRHRELIDIEMQPKFAGLSVGPEVTRRLMEELHRAALG